MNEPVTQEFLHAFVDGELAADERERALTQLENDPAFKARVCEIRTLKEQVKGAYAELPGRAAYGRTAQEACLARPWLGALAAGLLLTLGVGGGWMARDSADGPVQIERLAGLPSGYQPVSLSAHIDPNKVLLHLDSGEPERLGATLDLAESMLKERHGRGQLAIVVNTYGLDLLRQGVSPMQARVARMSSEHPNLSFVACGQTISRLRREGVDVLLVPEANVTSSAINEILSRMQRGWVYVKV